MIEQIEKGWRLEKWTTFGIGGPADFFLEVRDFAAMKNILMHCFSEKIPYFILGKGSNILFDDRGFRGLVILNKIDFVNKITEDIWHVGAGYSFSLLGSQTARQGFSGLEFAAGIPGSVGGAIYMNAGANGGETSSTLISVDYLSENGEIYCIPKSELKFGYRYSLFQDLKGAIVGGTFQLSNEVSSRKKQLELIEYRMKTQPYQEKSAGCVFRNPSGFHAGALIEQTGLKSLKLGGAQVSDMHANFVINTGTAKSSEILQLIELIREKVKAQTGVELESEIRYIPSGE